MAVVSPPAWIQAGSYTAHTDRLVTSSIVQDEGVVQAGDLAVTASSTPGMSVKIAPGRAWIRDASPGVTENKGMYNFVNDGDVTLAVSAAHASLARIDRVVAQVEDAAISGVNNIASLKVITGTPAGSPAAPALPASSLSLGTFNVAANATSVTNANITASVSLAKIHASMVNNVVVVTSSTRPTGANRTIGLRIFETDTLREWTWNGSEWQFRGGKGPKAYVTRPGTWTMPQTQAKLSSLEPETGDNFETAYFTFAPLTTPGQGDRIKVKQSGLYVLGIGADIRNSNEDFFVELRAIVSSGTGLPSFAMHLPDLSATYTRGRSQPSGSQTVFLPAGVEIAYQYEAGKTDTTVFAFWASATLIG